jgi:putative nucleotidyltransferase with HDIG domain
MHFNPDVDFKVDSRLDLKITLTTFWQYHVKPVIDIAKELSIKYQADMQVVWLGAMLHDIARLKNEEPHNEIGAIKARDLVLHYFSEQLLADKVAGVVLAHRCDKENSPVSLEEKIVATADAMSHFESPFYLWFATVSEKDMAAQLPSNLKKIEKDFQDKIFFKEEQERVRPYYEVLKKWCG